jgi:hypothetical protein
MNVAGVIVFLGLSLFSWNSADILLMPLSVTPRIARCNDPRKRQLAHV